MQLKVIKSDGSVEEYLHTKVMHTISNAFTCSENGDGAVSVAEDLAEVVTYFLYNKQKRPVINSHEIFGVIKASLAETGYEEAAVALSEYHFRRRLKRSRIEVIQVDMTHFADAEKLSGKNWAKVYRYMKPKR